MTAGAEDRFPQLTPEQMTAEQKQVAEAITSGPRDRTAGPFNARLRSPEVGERL